MSFRKSSLNIDAGPLSLGGLVLALGSAAPLPCYAAGTCELEVSGPDTPAWRTAVGALDLRAAEGSDCRTIRLALGGDDASRLTFETNDGRTAERELRDPSELAPTLEALLVTGTASSAPGSESESAPEPESAPAPTPRKVRARRLPPTTDTLRPTASEEARMDLLTAAFSLQLGVRGGAGSLVSPVVYGAVTMDKSDWELGVWGALEPSYAAFASSASDTAAPDVKANGGANEVRPVPVPQSPPGSAGVVGIMAGRRFPYTHLDIVSSARVGVAALRHGDGTDDGAEVRVGTALDLVFPRTSTLRFRTGLGLDVVPNDLRRSGMGSVPWWAFTTRLGIEVGGT